MASIQESIISKIEHMDSGAVFVASDFSDMADINTVRQVLSRQEKAGNIQRIFRGVYYCPVYSKLLGEYEAPDLHISEDLHKYLSLRPFAHKLSYVPD